MAHEPAFPGIEERKTSSDPFAAPKIINHPGMTLRDYFAGQALAGMLGSGFSFFGQSTEDVCAKTAWHAYAFADAMLAERAKSRD